MLSDSGISLDLRKLRLADDQTVGGDVTEPQATDFRAPQTGGGDQSNDAMQCMPRDRARRRELQGSFHQHPDLGVVQQTGGLALISASRVHRVAQGPVARRHRGPAADPARPRRPELHSGESFLAARQGRRSRGAYLTLNLACIIYWQAREISRIAAASDFPFDPELIARISPIEWKNVILYGEIKIDPDKLRIRGH